MIKLIATDMDGTLLNSQKELHKSFWDIFEQLQRENILFCVASGRQYHSLLEIFRPIADKIAFISENGAYVELLGGAFYESEMPRQKVLKILDLCAKIPHIGVALCGRQGAYIDTQIPDIQRQVAKYYSALHQVESLQNVQDAIFKITIYDKLGSRYNSLEHLEKLSQEFKVVISGDYWIDITNKGINKGIALQKIQEKLGVTPQQTMVFGDYLNDVEMMQQAAYSYAMKNAQPEVKLAARHKTQYDNEHQGVLRTICQVLNLPLPASLPFIR